MCFLKGVIEISQSQRGNGNGKELGLKMREVGVENVGQGCSNNRDE